LNRKSAKNSLDPTHLLTLLVHQRTKEKYYKDHEHYIQKEMKKVEKNHGEPFQELARKHPNLFSKDNWFWAPWRFNNIVGFVEIRLENPWTIIADLYQQDGRYYRKKPYLLNYATSSIEFIPNNLNSLQKSIEELIKELDKLFSIKHYVLEYDLVLINHIDFLEVLKRRGVNLEDNRSYLTINFNP
jgi:hypothetical protein